MLRRSILCIGFLVVAVVASGQRPATRPRMELSADAQGKVFVRLWIEDKLAELDGSGQLLGMEDRGRTIEPRFYDRFDWDELQGRIKQFGNLSVTYYDRFDWDELRGKVKRIGNVLFKYYDRFDWDETRGKLKSIGDIRFEYYDRFGPDEWKGKLKKAGNFTFRYDTGGYPTVSGADGRIRVRVRHGW